jgi:hypothetical protein
MGRAAAQGCPRESNYLILKRASASRSSGEWNEDDYDVLADGAVVGRILKVHAAPAGTPWKWTLAFWHHEDPHADTGLRCDAHGRHACEELAAGMTDWIKTRG